MSEGQTKLISYSLGLTAMLLLPVLLAAVAKGSVYLLVGPEDIVAVNLTDIFTALVYVASAATCLGYWFGEPNVRNKICLSISSLWKQ